MKKLLLIIALCSCLACGSLGIVKDKDASHPPTRTPAMALAAAEGSFSPKELSEATRPAPVFTAAPTDTPVPTAMPTWTPVPTATPTPIPVPMTISEVETAIAQGDFECIGTRVQFCGTVFHTLSDGDPVIPEGANFSVVVILRGLAETIPESTGVSGTGTISVCDTWSRITLELSQVVLD